MRYARGKNALGECRRCGGRKKLNELVADGHTPGLMVCRSCRDIKHPVEKPFRTDEGITLKRPVPSLDDDTVGDIEDTTGTALGGGAGYIDLALTASDLDGAYVNCAISITGGTGSGQSRNIQGYRGSARRAIVAPWDTPPDATSAYSITVGLLASRLGFDNYFGGAT